MSDLRTAAQQVVDERDAGFRGWPLEKAIDALKAALAEPVQEPVAWRVLRSDGQYELYFVKASAERAAECYISRTQVEPLYTAPQRQPLSDAEVYDLYRAMVKGGKSMNWLCRAIERAHGIGGQDDTR